MAASIELLSANELARGVAYRVEAYGAFATGVLASAVFASSDLPSDAGGTPVAVSWCRFGFNHVLND
jgi:hypothetical protein